MEGGTEPDGHDAEKRSGGEIEAARTVGLQERVEAIALCDLVERRPVLELEWKFR